MNHAIRLHAFGGPESLLWEEVDVPVPGPGQVLIRHTAIGVNFIDTYHRSGLYPVPLPFIPGVEGAGIVEAVGPGVESIVPGDRVAYGGPTGAYAELRVISTDRIVRLPDTIDDHTAAGVMLQGMTARFLLRETYPVKAGETILVHAAAGGVGLLLCQWAHSLGAEVIGTVSSEEKAALAIANGCDHVILYTKERFADRVSRITGGHGVAVVYDGVGQATFLESLDCLRPRGLAVLFGAASGPVPPFDLQSLAAKGSLFVTRPTLSHYTATQESLTTAATDVFAAIIAGTLRVRVHQTFPLAMAADAHRALQARRTTGATLLLPEN